MRRKIMGLIVSLLLVIQLITPVAFVSAAEVYTANKTGTHGGYDFELWKDYGNTTMTLNAGGTFSCQWNNIGNALFRKGKKFDCTKTYEQLGNIKVDYGVKYNPSGNSYLCVYGWTRNPLIEYYIVESWGSWRPPGAQSKGTITVDGGTYDVYVTDRINQPSIDGNTTFKQFWSVRTSKKTSGTISVSEHFKQWARMGMKLGKMYEVALTVEGYQSSGSADVYKNDIIIGGSSSSGGNVTPTQGTVTTPTPVNPGTDANIAEGTYYIKGVGSQKYLQVSGNTGADGQNVEIGNGTGVAGQKWTLAKTADGYVTLKSGLGNYMLDIAYGSADDGANAQIYSAYSGDPQKFQIKKDASGNYVILPKGGNGAQALDVANNSSAAGANVQQWTVNGNKNQQWIFEPVSGGQGGTTTTQTPAPTQQPQSQTPVQPSSNPGGQTGAGLPAGVTATYSVVSDWGGAYQAQIVLKNGSSQTLNNWQLAFNYGNKIQNLWGAELASQTGDQVLVKAPSWDANLAPGKSVTINFVANGSSSVVPSGYSTGAVPSQGGNTNPQPTSQPTVAPATTTAPQPTQPSINPNAKMVALTFDDGPSSTTSQVLDILEQNGAVATFFLIGQQVNGNTKAIMQRQVNMGCELACHSYTHQNMGNMSAYQVQDEISKCVNAIKSNVNVDVKFFRAPYLSTSQTMFNNINLSFIQGITCNDWENSCSAEQRKNTVLSSVSDGSIVLLHDFQGNNNTVQALPGIIQGLKAQGYTFVTVSDLFKYKGVNPNQRGKVWTNVYR